MPTVTSEQEAQVLERIVRFTSTVKAKAAGITVNSLVEDGCVNPYLARALGMKNMEPVAEFFFTRRMERSLGTSFGYVLDDTLRILTGGLKGSEAKMTYGTWIKWWDIVIPGRRIVVSVKSGPADMDKDQVEIFVKRAKVARRMGFQPFLVCAYGKQASSVICGYLEKWGFPPASCLRVGKEIFSEFLTPEYYKRYMSLFEKAGEETMDVSTVMNNRLAELMAELKSRYSDVHEMLDAMF